MEGLVLDLASLKRELQERKAHRSLKSSVSPLPAARPYRPYNVPASRQELVTQYKSPVLRKPWKLQEYKRDAAALLVESLEKHFAKRWITLKTQSDSNPGRKGYIGLEETLHRKSPEGLSFLSADFLRFRTDRKAGPGETTVSKAKAQNLSADLYGDAMLERLAMVSDRPSVPSPSPYFYAQKLMLALNHVLRRHREDTYRTIGLWGVKKAASEQIAVWLFTRINSEYRAAITCISKGKALEMRLFGQVLLRVKLRPYWEVLRLVTLRRLMAQLLALAMDKLAWVHQAVLRQAFSQLRTAPPPPPSPPLALKSVLQGLYVRRLQAAFNSTKRYFEHFAVKTAHISAKLAFCLQVFHLSRVKTMAKYLNRLRPASVSPSNRPKSAAIGLLLVGKAFVQAQTRGIQLFWRHFQTYSLFKHRENRKFQSANRLYTCLLQLSLKDCLLPLHLLRKASKQADLMRSGKKVVKRMIAVYLKDIHAKLGNGFFAWKRALVKEGEIGPEGPRISALLGGLIRRRLDWGFGGLKGKNCLIHIKQRETGKAIAGVMRLVLIHVFRPELRAVWRALALPIPQITPNPGYIGRIQASAARLIWKFTHKIARKGLYFCLYRLKFNIRCSGLVKTLLKRSFWQWKRYAQQIKQFQRGIELFARTFRRKLASHLQNLQASVDFSGLSSAFCEEIGKLSPSQALRLKLGLNQLQMHYSLVLKRALGVWKRTSKQLFLVQKQRQLAASVLLELSLPLSACLTWNPVSPNSSPRPTYL